MKEEKKSLPRMEQVAVRVEVVIGEMYFLREEEITGVVTWFEEKDGEFVTVRSPTDVLLEFMFLEQVKYW